MLMKLTFLMRHECIVLVHVNGSSHDNKFSSEDPSHKMAMLHPGYEQ